MRQGFMGDGSWRLEDKEERLGCILIQGCERKSAEVLKNSVVEVGGLFYEPWLNVSGVFQIILPRLTEEKKGLHKHLDFRVL